MSCKKITTFPGLVTAQNLALNKPVSVSSQGSSYDPPSGANDGDEYTKFWSEDIPWSFAAVDLQDTYTIDSISLMVSAVMRKWNPCRSTVAILCAL